MKHCPKCGSSRIRRGYAHDPLIIRMLGFRELLCDSCNLRFRGFVIPGTLPRSNRQTKNQESAGPGVERTPSSKSQSESKRCPNCGSEDTHRSHRRGVVENIVSTIGIYPYRCDDCNR